MTFSTLSTSVNEVSFAPSSSLNSARRDISGGEQTYASTSNWPKAYRIECMVRMRMSPTSSQRCPSRPPSSRLTVYRSVRTCVGCSPHPSPQLMTGMLAHLAASAGAPFWKWRMAITYPISAHGVQVGEDLRRVLTPSVPAVDDRDAGPSRRLGRGALLEVAHGDHVPVVLEHVHGVLDRLLIEVAGPSVLHVREAEHVAPEPVHGCLRGQAGPGRRLVERGQQRLVLQQVGVLATLGDRPQFV